jgi:hypothetical protein
MPEHKTIGNIENACIQCLGYFGIFKYPLTLDEVHIFNPEKHSKEEIGTALESLFSQGELNKINEFYLLENDSSWVEERLKGNRRAYELLKKSKRFVNIIASFPFVESIAISGSLSKFYASENPDIDYFIITKTNRLWIARTLLHLFKKLTFLIGYEHYFCMNYFIDTEALQIPSQNQYAAIECMTLLPAYNLKMNKQFMQANLWAKEFLPNHPGMINLDYLIKNRKRPIKAVFTFLLNIVAPKRLNRFWMKVTDRKWRKKWAKFNYSEDDYNRAFHTEIHISKNHPADYEKKVLNALDKKKQKPEE